MVATEIKRTKNEKEKNWKEINKLVLKVDEIVETLNKSFGNIKEYTDLYSYFNDLRGKLNEIDNNKQDLKVKLGEIYEKGFRSGMNFIDDTWHFDYEEQERYLVDGEHVEEGFGERWDGMIEQEIKNNIRNIN